MSLYETTFITRQDVTPNEVEKLTENFVNIIKEFGGKVVKKEYWGLRNLAYIIKKSRKGHYVFLGIDAPFDAIKEMQRVMSINEDIVRELTIKVDNISEEPTPLMSQGGKDYGNISTTTTDTEVEE